MKDAVDVAIRFGELSTSFDPKISEWGNLLPVKWKNPALCGEDTWGTEISQYPR
jgi:hypothetical protein